MKIGKLLETSLVFGKEHLPEIFAALAGVGVVSTGFLAYKAGKKTEEILKEKKRDMEDCDPDDKEAKRAVMWETAKEVTPIVAPAVIAGGATIVCIFMSTRESNKRIVALSAAYSLSESMRKDIIAKSEEVLGKSKVNEVRDEVAKDRAKEKEKDFKFIVPVGGKIRCMDGFIGTLFEATYQEVESAINRLTGRALNEGYVTVNDFYNILGIKTHPVGETLGWRDEEFMSNSYDQFKLTSSLLDDGTPVLVVMYEPSSVGGYWRVHER